MKQQLFPKLPELKTTTPTFVGKKVSLYQLQLQTKEGKVFKRELVDHPGACVILPLIGKEELLLIKNRRQVIGKTLWELPAGTLEASESPYDAAMRELIEETGYSTQSLTYLTAFYSSPGICNEVIYAYVAQDLTYSGQQLEESEEIEVHRLTWKEVKKMILDGTICDAKTLTTLLFYKEKKK